MSNVLFANDVDNLLSPDVRFMTDSTEGKDGAKEVIMDYVVSWTLRRAQNSCAVEKPILYNYCRRFLGLLLNQTIKDDDIVTVETWKQDNYIDLWVHVSINGISHDILIEDKYYSNLHDDQLTRYKEYFDKWLEENRKESMPHYYILSCMDSYDKKVSQYKVPDFKLICWDQMLEAMGCNNADCEPSESDIFNEFWINWTD